MFLSDTFAFCSELFEKGLKEQEGAYSFNNYI